MPSPEAGRPPARGPAIEPLLTALALSLCWRKTVLALGGILASGGAAWAVWRLAEAVDSEGLADGLGWIGLFLAWSVLAACAGAIAHVATTELDGRPAPGIPAALLFGLQRWPGLVAAPGLAWICLVLVMALGSWLLDRIAGTGAGIVLAALAFGPLTALIVGLVLVWLGLQWLTPAVSAASGGGPRVVTDSVTDLIRRHRRSLIVDGLLTASLAAGMAALLGGLVAGVGIWVQNNALQSVVQSAAESVLETGLDWFASGMGGSDGLDDLFGLPREWRLAGTILSYSWFLLLAAALAIPGLVFPVSAACAICRQMQGIEILPGEPSAPAPRPGQTAGTDRCPRCGAPLRPSARFCNHCGARRTG